MIDFAPSTRDADLVADLAQAAAELTAEEFKAFFRLRDYQRTRGRPLPPREKNLAVIAGVTLYAFRNMRAALSDFLPLADVPADVAVEPEKDAAKQAAGKKGADARWEKMRAARRDGIDLATARPIDSATFSAMHSAIGPMAKPMADGMADSHAGSHGDPPRAHGLTDGFSDEIQSVSPSDAGAGDGKTHGTTVGTLTGTTHGASLGTDDGAVGLLTMVAATGTGGTGDGRGMADAVAPARPIAVVVATDGEIEAVVRAAARKDGKPFLDPGWKSQGLFERIRGWIAEGISLRDDFGPALETYSGRSKGPVRNPANDEIRRMAEELRGKHALPESGKGVFVFEGTPGGDAWVERLGKADIFPYEREGRRYGLYATEFPAPRRALVAARG